MKILHITAHLGGGVGRAISALVAEEKQNCHEILCLLQPEKMQFVDACIATGTKVYICPVKEEIELSWYDVVIIHWWAHPTLIAFLADFVQIPVRLVLWVHISGCYYPALPFRFLDKAERIFFTSPYSFENKEWTTTQRQCVKQRATVLYGSGLLPSPPAKHVYRTMPEQYCVGYAGTFARSKLHPQFVKACAEIIKRLPNVYFLMVGDKESGAWIIEEAKALGIVNYFKFTGYMPDMECAWTEMDVLGYPLNPQHFGTTENVILESMCAGIPVILLNQATEKYVVQHKRNGILAKNIQDYVFWVVNLYGLQQFREELGTNAMDSIQSKYLHANITKKFQIEMKKIIENEKKLVSFKDTFGVEPVSWFISMLPAELRHIFEQMACGTITKKSEAHILTLCPYILKEKTKGSILHFSSLFPQDAILKSWAIQLKQGQHKDSFH